MFVLALLSLEDNTLAKIQWFVFAILNFFSRWTRCHLTESAAFGVSYLELVLPVFILLYTSFYKKCFFFFLLKSLGSSTQFHWCLFFLHERKFYKNPFPLSQLTERGLVLFLLLFLLFFKKNLFLLFYFYFIFMSLLLLLLLSLLLLQIKKTGVDDAPAELNELFQTLEPKSFQDSMR